MTHGMPASGSRLLTSIADALHEKTKKVNAVERLGNQLKEGMDENIWERYLCVIRDCIPDETVVLAYDSDAVKLGGEV